MQISLSLYIRYMYMCLFSYLQISIWIYGICKSVCLYLSVSLCTYICRYVYTDVRRGAHAATATAVGAGAGRAHRADRARRGTTGSRGLGLGLGLTSSAVCAGPGHEVPPAACPWALPGLHSHPALGPPHGNSCPWKQGPDGAPRGHGTPQRRSRSPGAAPGPPRPARASGDRDLVAGGRGQHRARRTATGPARGAEAPKPRRARAGARGIRSDRPAWPRPSPAAGPGATRTHGGTRTHIHVCMYTYIYTRTHAHTQICILARTHTYIYKCTREHIHTDTHIHTYMCVYTYDTHAPHTHTYISTYAHTDTYAYSHAYTPPDPSLRPPASPPAASHPLPSRPRGDTRVHTCALPAPRCTSRGAGLGQLQARQVSGFVPVQSRAHAPACAPEAWTPPPQGEAAGDAGRQRRADTRGPTPGQPSPGPAAPGGRASHTVRVHTRAVYTRRATQHSPGRAGTQQQAHAHAGTRPPLPHSHARCTRGGCGSRSSAHACPNKARPVLPPPPSRSRAAHRDVPLLPCSAKEGVSGGVGKGRAYNRALALLAHGTMAHDIWHMAHAPPPALPRDCPMALQQQGLRAGRPLGRSPTSCKKLESWAELARPPAPSWELLYFPIPRLSPPAPHPAGDLCLASPFSHPTLACPSQALLQGRQHAPSISPADPS